MHKDVISTLSALSPHHMKAKTEKRLQSTPTLVYVLGNRLPQDTWGEETSLMLW